MGSEPLLVGAVNVTVAVVVPVAVAVPIVGAPGTAGRTRVSPPPNVTPDIVRCMHLHPGSMVEHI